MPDPLGVGEPRPLLTWAVDGDRRPVSTRVRVARDEERLRLGLADLWDSGPLPGGSASASYDGAVLEARDRCVWQVEADLDDGTTLRSPVGRFEIGLLAESDWRARWIAAPPGRRTRNHRPCPHLRREFEVDDDVRDARLYISALGAFRVWMNGLEVTSDRLAPGWTDYRQRVPYRTYDPTALLRTGRNAIGVLLGDAWYCGRVGPYGRDRHYGAWPHLRLQLELHRADGSTAVIVTDDGWEAGEGAERRSDLQLGEIQDTRRAPGEWTVADARTGWGPAVIADPDSGPMVAAAGPPVRVIEELRPLSRRVVAPGVEIVDLGQNMPGWARLVVEGEAGATVVVRHAEALEENGRLHTANLRGADACDRYVLRGGRQELEPSFTTHGFRYLEVRTPPERAHVIDVAGQVVHTDLERVGTFSCSDPLLEAIHSNLVWSQRGNAVEIPTDCPQRDERLGWLGDALAFTPTALFNYDLAAWLGRWLDEVRLAQTSDGAFPDIAPLVEIPGLPVRDGAPGWGDAGVVVPWLHYVWYGDARVLARMFPAACAWVDRVAAQNPDGVWATGRGNDYGDWMAWEETPKDLVATAYHARSAAVLATIADVLGEHRAAARYRDLHGHVAAAFADRYLDAKTRIMSGSQTAYATALRFGLIPPSRRAAAQKHLVEAVERAGRVTCGYLGVGHLLPALTDAGAVETAYALAQSEEFPGWGNQIRHGATTMWERWDGWSTQRGFHVAWLNSLNHPSLGAIGEWLHATVGGIAPDPERPGFAHVNFAPRPGGGLTSGAARVTTIRGEVGCSWERAGGEMAIELTVPATSTATLRLPAPLDGETTLPLGPGHHAVTVVDPVVSA